MAEEAAKISQDSGSASSRGAGGTLVVSAGILSSRVLGLVRDMTLAAVWGSDVALAAFLTAWKLPNLLRSLFGEGAFSAAFVPSFSSALEQEGDTAAWRLAGRVLSLLFLGVSVAAALIAAAAVLGALFVENELRQTTLRFVPVLMPYAVFICLTAGFAGLLNTFQKFAVPAFSQIFLNVAWIGGALTAWRLAGADGIPSIWFLCGAVLAAGAAQTLMLYLACRKQGGRLAFDPAWRSADTRGVFRLMGPAVLGAGVHQINVLVDQFLALLLGSQAVTSLYFSQRLVYLPVGLFAVAGVTVSLPMMSRAWSRGDGDEMAAILREGIRRALFLSLPCFFLLFMVRMDIVKLFFLRGNFTPRDAAATAWALLFYLPGIPAFVLTKFAVTPFHARKNTRTPVIIAVFCLVVNVVLNVILMRFLAQGGLALATSVCGWLNVVLLLIVLTRSGSVDLGLRRMLPNLGKLAVAALCGMTACALTMIILSDWRAGGFAGRLTAVSLAAFFGGGTYLAACLVMRCPEARDTLDACREKTGKIIEKFK
ncbi:MAG: murein biosynthesis integral membrane protein MurJ [Lentisphaeria bacterium]|nr:murein biosynthesis integral membrane protein MurJ [Lentisphaeria bacterium]